MITRFAPSPTGPLHLGHAYSALLAYDAAQAAGGTFLLRIEDIDQTRARSHWEEQIYDDLQWLGLGWPSPVMRQSERLPAYQSALQTLWNNGLLYPCTCSRRDIQNALEAPQEGVPTHGPDGLIYPGTCRQSPRDGPLPENTTLRLDTHKAQISNNSFGDIVLARRDMNTSYHLSVVLDDAAQNITHVIRGKDLLEATDIHIALQKLLGLPTPIYQHHKLIRDENGKRLAKRDDARALSKFRAEGATPQDIRHMVGL